MNPVWARLVRLDTKEEWNLDDDLTLIGKGRVPEVRIDDNALESLHARITLEESSGKAYVGILDDDPYEILDQDTFDVGPYKLRFVRVPSGSPMQGIRNIYTDADVTMETANVSTEHVQRKLVFTDITNTPARTCAPKPRASTSVSRLHQEEPNRGSAARSPLHRVSAPTARNQTPDKKAPKNGNTNEFHALGRLFTPDSPTPSHASPPLHLNKFLAYSALPSVDRKHAASEGPISFDKITLKSPSLYHQTKTPPRPSLDGFDRHGSPAYSKMIPGTEPCVYTEYSGVKACSPRSPESDSIFGSPPSWHKFSAASLTPHCTVSLQATELPDSVSPTPGNVDLSNHPLKSNILTGESPNTFQRDANNSRIRMRATLMVKQQWDEHRSKQAAVLGDIVSEPCSEDQKIELQCTADRTAAAELSEQQDKESAFCMEAKQLKCATNAQDSKHGSMNSEATTRAVVQEDKVEDRCLTNHHFSAQLTGYIHEIVSEEQNSRCKLIENEAERRKAESSWKLLQRHFLKKKYTPKKPDEYEFKKREITPANHSLHGAPQGKTNTNSTSDLSNISAQSMLGWGRCIGSIVDSGLDSSMDATMVLLDSSMVAQETMFGWSHDSLDTECPDQTPIPNPKAEICISHDNAAAEPPDTSLTRSPDNERRVTGRVVFQVLPETSIVLWGGCMDCPLATLLLDTALPRNLITRRLSRYHFWLETLLCQSLVCSHIKDPVNSTLQKQQTKNQFLIAQMVPINQSLPN
eukprot:gene8641-216_t